MIDIEKLNEVLDSFSTPIILGDVKIMDWNIPTKHIRDDLVAHLIANGVRLETKQVTSDENKRWIPVSERMPEEHESIFARMYGTERWMPGMFRMGSDEVLGAVRNNDGTISVQSMRTLDGEWSVSRIFQGEVTHWMPLPEPPREERQ